MAAAEIYPVKIGKENGKRTVYSKKGERNMILAKGGTNRNWDSNSSRKECTLPQM